MILDADISVAPEDPVDIYGALVRRFQNMSSAKGPSCGKDCP